MPSSAAKRAGISRRPAKYVHFARLAFLPLAPDQESHDVCPSLTDAGPWLVFSDLDGTLLDHDTYRPTGCEELLLRLNQAGVPVIFCTSKTAVETLRWQERLGIHTPFIVENGAAIHFPQGPPGPEGVGEPNAPTILLGRPREDILRAFDEIRRETGLPLRGFSKMNADEISRRTGLALEDAQGAARRDHSEPFVFRKEPRPVDLSALDEAVRKRRLRWTRGGRFFHLMGDHDKGTAVSRLHQAYREAHPEIAWKTLALGDSPNDAPMLSAVDVGVLVRRPDGSAAQLPQLSQVHVTRGIGPAGWREAMCTFVLPGPFESARMNLEDQRYG